MPSRIRLKLFKRRLVQRSNQHQLVLDIVECSKTLDVELTSEHYHSVLRSCAAVGNMKVALGMRDTLQQIGLSMTDDGFYWLVHCACRANQWELVQGLLTPGDKEGLVPTANMFNAAIAAYGNKKRWSKVLDVYDIMPEDIRVQLKGWHPGAVIMAHAKAESKEVKLQALEILKKHEDKANELAYGGAITALLETDQFDAALALAEDMKQKNIAWGKDVYQAVALALIPVKKLCICWKRAFNAWEMSRKVTSTLFNSTPIVTLPTKRGKHESDRH